MSDYDYTEKQGQYLAFIYNYTVMHGEPPSEADMQRFFRVSPPTVHQMVLKLDDLGLISRVPRESRTIRVLVPPEQLPLLEEPSLRKRSRSQAVPLETPIYQIKITLEESEPPIWRRILVRSDITLGKLHDIIQEAMGWTNSHLHQFIVGQTYYSEPYPDYEFEMRDERKFKLAQIVSVEGFKFRYEYDFGDSWLHLLSVEEILPPEPGQRYPVCIKGKRACPPEDVGGVWGYMLFLEAIQNPEHPEHDEYLEWVGGQFDPETFDLDTVNAVLRSL